MASVLDQFLNRKETVEVPIEGEQFPSSGYIGPVRAKMLWRFGSNMDFSSSEYRDDVPQPFYREQFPNGGFNYFYATSEAAKVAAQIDGEAYNPQQVWYFSVPINEIINVNTENFQGNSISRSCRVTTLRSKYRHEFHMIALPAMVAAVAKLDGVDVPGFDLSELMVRDTVITDEMSRRLIGGTLDSNGKFITPNYEESELWAKRAELWKALGEDDPKKYTVGALKPNSTEEAPSNTASKKLQDLLSVYINPWEEAMWARFVMVNDPRIGAVTSGGKNLSLPAIIEMFRSKADAEKAAAEDRARFGQDAPAAKAKAEDEVKGDFPPLPEGWTDAGEWIEEITPFLSMNRVQAKKAYSEEDYGATFEEMWEWVKWEKAK